MATGIVDIAKRLNLSHTTVSRVMNNRTGTFISEKTRQKVLKAALEMDYRPNVFARALRGASTNTIGIVVPEFFKHVDPVEQLARDSGFRVHMAAHHRSPEQFQRIIEDFSAHSVDGILAHSVVDGMGDILGRCAKVPVALCCEEPVDGYDCFIDTRYQATRIAMSYLAELGHKRIGLVVNHTMPQMRWRVAGYHDAMTQMGLAENPQWLVDMPSDVPSAPRGYAGMKKALAQWSPEERPTAVLCTNDDVAVGVLAAAQEAGVSVPEEMSVVGMMNLAHSCFARVPLTTVDWDVTGLVVNAMKRLIHRISNPDIKPVVDAEEPRMVVRDSACPPQDR